METCGGPFGITCLTWMLFAGLVIVIVLAIVALLSLRRRHMDEIARFLWALLIVLLPVVGPIAFFIVRPEDLTQEHRRNI